MSRFSGKQGKGAMTKYRVEKRTMAEKRSEPDPEWSPEERLLRAIFGNFSPSNDQSISQGDKES